MRALRQILLNTSNSTINVNLGFTPKKLKIKQYFYTNAGDDDVFDQKLTYVNENQDLLIIANVNTFNKIINISDIECEIKNWNGQMHFMMSDEDGTISPVANPVLNILIEFSD